MNYNCMDDEEIEDDVCLGLRRIILSAPVRLMVILFLGELHKHTYIYIFLQ